MKQMKKLLIFTALFIFLLPILNLSARAVEIEENQAEAMGIDKVKDELPSSAEEILSDVEFKDLDNVETAMGRIKESIYENMGGSVRKAVQTGSAVLAVSLIISFVGMICPQNEKYEMYASVAGVLSIAVLTVGDVDSLIGTGAEVIGDLYAFSKALLPTLAAACAAGGAVSTAAAQYAASALFMDLLQTLGNEVILPLIYGYVIASLAGIAFGSSGLSSAANFIKWIIVTLMTIMVLVLTVYLTVSGIVLGAADDAAAKVAKTALSSLLPVVGSLISDASGAVVGGINTLKNLIGVFGLIVVLAVCAVPFMRLVINSIVFKIISVFAGTMSASKISSAVNTVSAAYAMILGLCGSVAIMLFISVISVLKAVTNV